MWQRGLGETVPDICRRQGVNETNSAWALVKGQWLISPAATVSRSTLLFHNRLLCRHLTNGGVLSDLEKQVEKITSVLQRACNQQYAKTGCCTACSCKLLTYRHRFHLEPPRNPNKRPWFRCWKILVLPTFRVSSAESPRVLPVFHHRHQLFNY